MIRPPRPGIFAQSCTFMQTTNTSRAGFNHVNLISYRGVSNLKSIKSQYGLVNEVSIDAVMLRILTNCSVMTKSMITALTGKKLRVSPSVLTTSYDE